MSYFAKIETGIVTNVISAEQPFIDSHYPSEEWVQTSYNTHGGKHYGQDGLEDSGVALRYNYAGIGYTYDTTKDAFIEPQPFSSWTLDETTCQWEPPVAYPTDDKRYKWDEDTTAWVEVAE